MGYLKPAPGTWGSLAAMLFWWFLVPPGLIPQLGLIVIVTAAGIWAAGRMEQLSGGRDPSIVVIDEVAGMWCALLAAQQVVWHYLVALTLFRVLDIVKPGPIRRLEALPGGWGVMLDDLAAGIVTLGAVLALRLLI